MDPRKFFSELKRRNVYRAAVGYAAVAWLLIQIATQTFPFFEIPTWAVRLVIVILLAGFPFALAWAWAFELTAEGIVRTEEVPADKSIARETGRKINFIIIAVLLLAVAVLLFDRFGPGRARHTFEAPEKSIAVLPFENLTSEQENAFFADGLQDDILTSLAKIQDLKVISRTSTLAYRGGKDSRNLRLIGEALGVASILEGSVRRVENRVRLTVQLIDTRSDQHIWADTYDRTISDALTLQGELAKEVAAALHAKLSPEEKERVERKPTNSADAYVLYLRARQYEMSPDTLLQDYRLAEQLYDQAIVLDPQFALAHAGLATTRAAIFHYYDPTDALQASVLAGATEALRLQPNLGEGHTALGLYHYWTKRDYAKALEQFAIAERLSPNDTNVRLLSAAVQRRRGLWRKALESFKEIEKRDPQNPNIVRNLVYTHSALRNWDDAVHAAERMRTLAPDSVSSAIQGAFIHFLRDGSTAALKNVLGGVAPGVDPDGVVTAGKWDVALIERDFGAAEQAIANCGLEAISYLNGQLTARSFFLGCVELARGETEEANVQFELARPSFEDDVKRSPENAERHANLGLLYALMGRKEAAIQAGRRAVELKPVSKDAYDGTTLNCYLAVIYARTGEPKLALDLLEQLLKTPGAVDSTLYSITQNDLRFRWVWDPLRDHPRFQQLVGPEGSHALAWQQRPAQF